MGSLALVMGDLVSPLGRRPTLGSHTRVCIAPDLTSHSEWIGLNELPHDDLSEQLCSFVILSEVEG